MLEILDWQSVAEPRAVVRRAVETLRAGGCVAFPTESSYALAACALCPEAVRRISGTDKAVGPLAVAVGGLTAARDWVPGLSPLGQRLARRFWPGPLTLLCADGVADGLAGRLPAPVREALAPDGGLRLRTPAHRAILEVLSQFRGPLVLLECAGGNGTGAGKSDVVRQQAGERVDLLIDGGASSDAPPPTVVHVQGNAWKVVQPGSVTAEQIAQQSVCVVVFVCTGNTCRSPMAEGLCKKLLADRLGCAAADLPGRGFYVLSAGLAAMMGEQAAPEAVQVGQGYGTDLTGHQSRPLTEDLAAQADFLVAMTRGHLMALTDHFPRLGSRPRLLSPQGDDVPDPIGSPLEVYQNCAGKIWRCLEPLVADIMK
jgi:L-threonylcarbamoyladenylate synthase